MPIIHVCDTCHTESEGDGCQEHPDASLSSIVRPDGPASSPHARRAARSTPVDLRARDACVQAIGLNAYTRRQAVELRRRWHPTLPILPLLGQIDRILVDRWQLQDR